MKHLILCNEYPPTPQPPGGIGTYVYNISRLLAESGETVHVIAQSGGPNQQSKQFDYDGRLVIHRVPFIEGFSPLKQLSNSRERSEELDALFQSAFPPQCFSWQASLLAEKLVEEEGIDVIESQEFQAPLYYFQLRRALGLGPNRVPPCIIHLHSPTEFICLHNGWDINYPFYQTAKRLEDYCIGAADALLCPSHYFAQQAERTYRLASGSVEVIPLPIGDTPFIERSELIWSEGTVCYIGRLEERKGVVEWIDAAVAVAKRHSSVKFEFVGANLLGNNRVNGEEFLNRRIPKSIRERFIFRGSQKRNDLPRFLQQARIAVVPSRWENFPNTCVEAMCSGLPVLATREGGMVEMVEEGKTGWLVKKPSSSGLEEGLEHALSTPSFQLEAMGCAASTRIRALCDNKATVAAHIAFRKKVIEAGTPKSIDLPLYLPLGHIHSTAIKKPKELNSRLEKGIVVIINFMDSDRSLKECLQHLSGQTRVPLTVILMQRESENTTVSSIFESYLEKGWQLFKCQNIELNFAQDEVVKYVLNSGLDPLGFSFINPGDLLCADFIEVCEKILFQCSRAGIISCWSRYMGTRDKYWLRPCPSFPYQWMKDDVVPFSVFRTEALLKSLDCATKVGVGYEIWDRSAAILGSGWAAVTVPRILSTSLSLWDMPSLEICSPQEHIIALKRLHQKFKPLVSQYAEEVSELALSEMSWSANLSHTRAKKLLHQTEILVFYSRKVLWYLLDKLRNRVWNFLVFLKYELVVKLK